MSGNLTVKRITVSHRTRPLGIEGTPYFSWILSSDKQNVRQASYEIRITSVSGELFWDSARVKSPKSAFVLYEGKPLKSAEEYKVFLKVCDEDGDSAEGDTSFETGLFKEDWTAEWRLRPAPHAPITEKYRSGNPSTLFKKDFICRGEVKKARLYATCHGVYKAYLNGLPCGERELAPENTTYTSRLFYQTYDVTGLLRAPAAEALSSGRNTLIFHVGDGWYHAAQTRITEPDYTASHAILFELHIIYKDGASEVIKSDPSLLYTQGPVVYSNLFHGETYDARRESLLSDESSGAEKDSACRTAADALNSGTVRNDPSDGFSDWLPSNTAEGASFELERVCAQPADPVVRAAVLKPETASVREDGSLLFDFGIVFAGRVRMDLEEPEGNTVTVTHCEALDLDGNPFPNFTNEAKQTIEYISAGESASYEPLFTYQGFRYALVSGVKNPDKFKISAVVLTSEKESLSEFTCSDERINTLVSNAKRSQISNTISIPTDCPQREKAGWTGDINVYAETALLNEDMTAFLTLWLENLACDQYENGLVPCVSPLSDKYRKSLAMIVRLFGGIKTPAKDITSAGWGDVIINLPYVMYEITGNTLILREMYPAMKKWISYVRSVAENRRGKGRIPKEDDKYLWNRGFHWGEWFIPDLVEKNIITGLYKSIHTGARYVSSAYYFNSVKQLAEIARILGESGDEAFYKDLASRIKGAYQRNVLKPDGSCVIDTQGAYVLALAFGLVPDDLKKSVAARLVKMIKDNGMRLNTGFLPTPFLLDVLEENGYPDIAYALLYQDRRPSWLYEVRHGATSIWESWSGMDENGAPSPSVSLNHYAFGSVAAFIYKSLAGVKETQPGFSKFRIAPVPDDHLMFCKYGFLSEYGPIRSEWEIKDGRFYLAAEVPCNTRAEIILPDGSAAEVGSGKYRFECEMAGYGLKGAV